MRNPWPLSSGIPAALSVSPDPAIVHYKLELIHKEILDTRPLFDLLSQRSPDSIEIRAAGAILQSVYNGMESILELFVARDPDPGASAAWHRNLLERAATESLIDEGLSLDLEILRKFRHKFRHSYGFMLEWSMMRDAFLGLPALTERFRATIKKRLGQGS